MDNPREIVINGVAFKEREGYPKPFRFDYIRIIEDIHNRREEIESKGSTVDKELMGAYRFLILNDLWFILAFVMAIPMDIIYRPFVIGVCQEVEDGPDGWCMDLWTRFHFKTSIKTKARTLQRILKYPTKCTMLGSHTRPIAKQKFLRPIKELFEVSQFLKDLFPEVLYQNPKIESPKWSEDDGIIVKGHNPSRGEATLEAYGIKDGMPISAHYDWILLDDLETKSDVKNPDVIQTGRDAVDLCNFLLTEGGSIDITGTPYSHLGIYIPHILEKKRANGEAKYLYRRKPGTVDGTKDGKPVMMTWEAMADIYAELSKDGYGEYSFNCQILIDPTPKGTQTLNGSLMMDIDPKYIPDNLVKFMLIDPAGDAAENRNKGDDWAIWIVGVDPEASDSGLHKRYILDGFLEVLTESAAPELLGRIYMRHPAIRQVGYEFKGIAPAWMQNFCEYVRKAGGTLYEDPKMNMVVRLKDGGRQKGIRITSAISWPLNNHSLFISTSVPDSANRKLREEMDKFGFWPDNGLDSLAYLDDILRTFDLNVYRKKKGDRKKDIKNNEYCPFDSVREGR